MLPSPSSSNIPSSSTSTLPPSSQPTQHNQEDDNTSDNVTIWAFLGSDEVASEGNMGPLSTITASGAAISQSVMEEYFAELTSTNASSTATDNRTTTSIGANIAPSRPQKCHIKRSQCPPLPAISDISLCHISTSSTNTSTSTTSSPACQYYQHQERYHNGNWVAFGGQDKGRRVAFGELLCLRRVLGEEQGMDLGILKEEEVLSGNSTSDSSVSYFNNLHNDLLLQDATAVTEPPSQKRTSPRARHSHVQFGFMRGDVMHFYVAFGLGWRPHGQGLVMYRDTWKAIWDPSKTNHSRSLEWTQLAPEHDSEIEGIRLFGSGYVFDEGTLECFVYGGCQSLFDLEQNKSSDLIRYSVEDNKWHLVRCETHSNDTNAHPGGLYCVDLHLYKHYVLLYGGRKRRLNSRSKTSVHLFNRWNQKWTRMEVTGCCPPVVHAYKATKSVLYGGRYLLVLSCTETSRNVHSLDLQNQTWTFLSTWDPSIMPVCTRFSFQCLPSERRLIVYGGSRSTRTESACCDLYIIEGILPGLTEWNLYNNLMQSVGNGKYSDVEVVVAPGE